MSLVLLIGFLTWFAFRRFIFGRFWWLCLVFAFMPYQVNAESFDVKSNEGVISNTGQGIGWYSISSYFDNSLNIRYATGLVTAYQQVDETIEFDMVDYDPAVGVAYPPDTITYHVKIKLTLVDSIYWRMEYLQGPTDSVGKVRFMPFNPIVSSASLHWALDDDMDPSNGTPASRAQSGIVDNWYDALTIEYNGTLLDWFFLSGTSVYAPAVASDPSDPTGFDQADVSDRRFLDLLTGEQIVDGELVPYDGTSLTDGLAEVAIDDFIAVSLPWGSMPQITVTTTPALNWNIVARAFVGSGTYSEGWGVNLDPEAGGLPGSLDILGVGSFDGIVNQAFAAIEAARIAPGLDLIFLWMKTIFTLIFTWKLIWATKRAFFFALGLPDIHAPLEDEDNV
jgi:hypothetical protein